MTQPQSRFCNRSRLRSIAYNASWLGAERIVRAATSFVVVVWVARTLGPEFFGALNFAQSIVVGLVPLVTMGLGPVLVRDLVRYPDKRDNLLASAALLRLGGAFILFVIAQIIAYLLTRDHQTMWLVAIIGLGVFAYVADGIDCDYQARMQNKTLSLVKLMAFAFCTGLKISLIYLSASVEWFAIAMSLENLLAALLIVQVARHSGHSFIWRPSLRMIRSLLTQGAPFCFAALLVNLFGRVDQVLLGVLAGYDTLGIYAVAWKIVEALGMFPYFAVSALAPVLSSLQRESQELFESRYALATRILFGSSALISLALTFLLPDLLPWAFGAKYVDAVSPARILLWILPLTVLSHMTFQWVLHNDGISYIIGQGSFMLLTGVVFCWYAISVWGSIGAAAAIFLSQLLANIIYPIFSRTGRCVLGIQMKSLFTLRRS